MVSAARPAQSASPPSLDATCSRFQFPADLDLSYHLGTLLRTAVHTRDEHAYGVARASITRLDSHVAELEDKANLTAEDRLAAQHLLQKVNSLDAEFKSYHLSVVDLIEDDALEGEQVVLDEHDDRIARLTVRVQQLALMVTQAVAAPSSSKGSVRLPKISVPTFDGNVVNWQFTVSLHDWSELSPAAKLTYLRHAVKDSPAKHVVEQLSGSGEDYEAIDCMCKRATPPPPR